jgi:hypothetical protein
LQELEDFNREMRWLHNQSLHQPGIGSGYVPTGKKGDREVSIGPGYALDAMGREIVLTQTRTEPVPPVAHDGNGKPVWYDLTVSYPPDGDLKASETREGICLPRGVVRLREEPVFCWVRLSLNESGQVRPDDQRLEQQVRDGLKIVVARAEVFNCQLNRDLCLAQRRNAHPPTQPYIACGREIPTTWETWKINKKLIGFQTIVNTTEARFQVTPCYTARIEAAAGVLTGLAESLSLLRALLVVQIVDPSATQFGLRALLARGLGLATVSALAGGLPNDFLKMSKAKTGADKETEFLKNLNASWQVVWFGVEG